jgi:hypothetical protein
MIYLVILHNTFERVNVHFKTLWWSNLKAICPVLRALEPRGFTDVICYEGYFVLCFTVLKNEALSIMKYGNTLQAADYHTHPLMPSMLLATIVLKSMEKLK